MRKIYVAAILSIFLFAVSGGFEVSAQPNQFNITNIEPSNLAPGTVFAVNGGPFIDENSEIYIGGAFALETHYQNENKLIAIIPLEANICGEQGIIVKTTVNLNNTPTPVDSNFVVKVINCPNPNDIKPIDPKIDQVQLLDLVSGAGIQLTGQNFIPPTDNFTFYGRYSNNNYPYTEVRVYNDSYEYKGPGEFQSFGVMRFYFEDGVYCGDYKVEAKNHFASNVVSVPPPGQFFSQYNFTIDEYCIPQNGNAPPENGVQTGYEVMNLNLPSTAYVNDLIQGTVEIKHTGSYSVREEMELWVNGEKRDTEEILITGSETKTFPLQFRFDRPGNYNVEIRVNESYKKYSIEVSSQNGNTPQPQPSPGGNDLSSYDSDGNCELSDPEFFSLLDAWLSNSASDSTFFAGVDAWIGGGGICSSSAAGEAVQLQMSSQGLSIKSSESSLGLVNIYDAAGREVYSHNSTSNRLVWNLRDVSGSPVANGVYLASINGELKKFIVIR